MIYKDISVYVCDTQVNAAAAKLALQGLGFNLITVDEVTGFVQSDAETFGGGGKKDMPPSAKYVVIGKRT